MIADLRNDAENAYKAGKYTDAIETYRQILELAPEDARAHQELARSLYATGDLDDCSIECHRALELHAGLSMPHLILGKILAQKGSLDGCESEARKAVELDSSMVEAYNLLAALYIQRKKYKDAIDIAQVGAIIDPKAWSLRRVMALAYYSNGQGAEAYKEAWAALEIRPSFQLAFLVADLFLWKYRLLVGICLGGLAVFAILTKNLVPLIVVLAYLIIGAIQSYRIGRRQASYLALVMGAVVVILYAVFKP